MLTTHASNGNFADQSPFQCRVDWGPKGTIEAASRGDIVIIIDVIRFSSAVVTAVHYGAIVYPFPMTGDVNVFAASLGAEVIRERGEGGKVNRPSLSPGSYTEAHKGERFVLASPNGATCTKVSGKVPALLVGSFLNASAVAKAANELQKQTGDTVTVIACGERWVDATGGEDHLRPSIEDFLCAGAILKSLGGTKSPESKVCIAAFEACRGQLEELVFDSGSGREIRLKGLDDDVRYTARLDVFQEVPILVQDDLHKSYFVELGANGNR